MNMRAKLSRSLSSQKPLPILQFWLLVFILWVVSQTPYIHIPFDFLATWVHELGHGLGAIFSGGDFISMQVMPDFSGVAYTQTSSDFQRCMVIIMGLLGPVLMGSLMLILSRGLWAHKLALALVAGVLILSSLFWAADWRTRLISMVIGVGLFFLAYRLPNRVRMYLVHILAISFGISGIFDFQYFFMGGDPTIVGLTTDTQALSEILGGPYYIWGLILSILSLTILYGTLRLTGTIGEREDKSSHTF